MEKSGLGDRMKRYEIVPRNFLSRRTPVIIRLDGKAFHTFTKKCVKPYDETLHHTMCKTTQSLVEMIQGAVFGYTQSDEISILVRDWDQLTTEAWYDYNVQKMTSVSASIATAHFNKVWGLLCDKSVFGVSPNLAYFDSRVFNLPKEEVVNYFIWRQQDATRNSINSLGQFHFSQKQLNKKTNSQVKDMLILEKNINWNDTETWAKRGSCVIRQEDGVVIDKEIPLFSMGRNFIEKHLLEDKNE